MRFLCTGTSDIGHPQTVQLIGAFTVLAMPLKTDSITLRNWAEAGAALIQSVENGFLSLRPSRCGIGLFHKVSRRRAKMRHPKKNTDFCTQPPSRSDILWTSDIVGSPGIHLAGQASATLPFDGEWAKFVHGKKATVRTQIRQGRSNFFFPDLDTSLLADDAEDDDPEISPGLWTGCVAGKSFPAERREAVIGVAIWNVMLNR